MLTFYCPSAWNHGLGRRGLNKEYVEDEVRLLENMQSHDVLHAKDICGCLHERKSFCIEQENGRMGGIVKLYGYLTNFFISAIQSFSDVRKRPDLAELINSEGIRNRAVRIAKYMWKHCDQDITIQTVAMDLNYSRRHVQRIISEYFGMGFAELLTQYRLGKAKTLLCHSNDSLERVAQKSGFNDARTLRRKFKEQLDLTPSDYRSQMKQRQSVQSQRAWRGIKIPD